MCNGNNHIYTFGQPTFVEKTLVNKSGKWQYSTIPLSLPEENTEGKIMDLVSGKLLSPLNDSIINNTLVLFEDSEDGLITDGQKWLIGEEDQDGWFLITNCLSNRVLTATSETETNITGIKICY